MNIILLSGGSGKRLWPLSSDKRSKQFLQLLPPGRNEDAPGFEEPSSVSGRGVSMLQRMYNRLDAAGLSDNIIIAAGESQRETIIAQLGDKVSIVAEPERRNTFPAIALSCAYLRFVKGCGMDGPVVILPVDLYVEDDFFKSLHHICIAADEGAADIILMGVKPTHPTEKYGYIVPESAGSGVNAVAEFREKPPADTAARLIKKGALWNCGVFAFKLGFMMRTLSEHIKFETYDDVLRQYNKLESTSFDYAVVEKTRSVSVAGYNGSWRDLGTWNTLTEIMESSAAGNVIAADCSNTHVIDELGIPIVVLGASDMVIVSTPDGILVADKAQSPKIAEYLPE